jgi:hypothetical protein
MRRHSGAGRDAHVEAPAQQQVAQRRQHRRLVVHRQHAQPLPQAVGRRVERRPHRHVDWKHRIGPDAQAEHAAPAGGGPQHHLRAHQRRKSPHVGEPEPKSRPAATVPVRPWQAAELLEHRGVIRWRDAPSAVADLECRLRGSPRDEYAAVRGGL